MIDKTGSQNIKRLFHLTNAIFNIIEIKIKTENFHINVM